jgi:hypothetical protein
MVNPLFLIIPLQGRRPSSQDSFSIWSKDVENYLKFVSWRQSAIANTRGSFQSFSTFAPPTSTARRGSYRRPRAGFSGSWVSGFLEKWSNSSKNICRTFLAKDCDTRSRKRILKSKSRLWIDTKWSQLGKVMSHCQEQTLSNSLSVSFYLIIQSWP